MDFEAAPAGRPFTVDSCTNCGRLLVKLFGRWTHLERDEDCDPHQVDAYRRMAWEGHDRRPDLYPQPDFPRPEEA